MNLYTKYSGTTVKTEDDLKKVAWYYFNSGDGGGKTHVVNTKPKNTNPIKDMSGNVVEWCWDWYEDYDTGAVVNPTGATSSSFSARIVRGGCWGESAVFCTVSERLGYFPDRCTWATGFRIVCR